MPSIIGGKYKRAKIEVPSKLVRPTSAIKREAIFSILESYALQNSINIYKNKLGKPNLFCLGKTKTFLNRSNISNIFLSLSDENKYIISVVIVEYI